MATFMSEILMPVAAETSSGPVVVLNLVVCWQPA